MFIAFSCIMNIIGNLLFLVFMDSFTTLGWYDESNHYHTFSLDQFGLLVFTLVKIAVCWIFYKQSKEASDIFSPIVQEYFEAQSTQGIHLTERKTKKMQAYSTKVRKNTKIVIAITWITSIYAALWVKGTVEQYLDA